MKKLITLLIVCFFSLIGSPIQALDKIKGHLFFDHCTQNQINAFLNHGLLYLNFTKAYKTDEFSPADDAAIGRLVAHAPDPIDKKGNFIIDAAGIEKPYKYSVRAEIDTVKISEYCSHQQNKSAENLCDANLKLPNHIHSVNLPRDFRQTLNLKFDC